MKYLTLAADLNEVSLRDEAVGPVGLSDLNLPGDLPEAVAAWNDRYQEIIPMETGEREEAEVQQLIQTLDAEGMSLAARIADALPEHAKVAYFSEGLLRRL